MGSDAIREFWEWWPSIADAVDEGIRNGGIAEELIEGLSQHVTAIDSSLDWELGPGHEARHHLCLSAKGDPKLRVVAERWLHRAPSANEIWEFHAARQANPGADLSLTIAEHDVDFERFLYRIEVDAARELLDIEVFHPVLPQVDDEGLRQRIVFIGLDNTLGEDGVERWIGGVEVLLEPPTDGVGQKAFVERVERLSSEATGEQWAVLRGTIEGAPVVVTTNRAIKRVDHLLLSLHVTITLPLQEPTEDGLSTQAEADTLNELEDRLLDALAEHAVHVGRETQGGVRTLHLHVMDEGPAAAIIDKWKQQQKDYAIDVEVSPDPEWDVLQFWG